MPKRVQELSTPKQISLTEFFEKNRHILGFDSPQKALFMIVKEAIDNSLDACEENSIVPDIYISISRVKGGGDGDEFSVTVSDNGPGIKRDDVPNVFGKLLYGSRFHAYRQSRGQQGIGITAAVLYGQITTGKDAEIITKIEKDPVAYHFVMGINIKDNTADVKSLEPEIWDRPHGTEIRIFSRGKYQTGKQSIIEYLRESAAANPNLQLTFKDPDERITVFNRVVNEASRPAQAIKPYPIGLEIGEIGSIAKQSQYSNIVDFLSGEFSRITKNISEQIVREAGIDPMAKPASLTNDSILQIKNALMKVKILPPETICLSPLGELFIRKGLMNVYGDLKPSFYSRPIIRKPSIYNGNPFAVEVGLVYGGDIPPDQPIRIVRYANKVPLLYQQGACAITKAVQETDWRPYGLDQRGGQGIPFGPAIVLVHVYGVKVPYTSESKEAIAPVSEIVQEIQLSLKDAGREIKRFLRKSEKRKKIDEKFRLVNLIIPEIAKKASKILSENPPRIDPVISRIANVVIINESYERKGEMIISKCVIHNYTTYVVTLDIYAEPIVGEIKGEQKVHVDSLESSGTREIEFLVDPGDGTYTGCNFYFTGIDPVYVLGADPLPADWGIKGVDMEEKE